MKKICDDEEIELSVGVVCMIRLSLRVGRGIKFGCEVLCKWVNVVGVGLIKLYCYFIFI